ncbi:MAG: N-acetylmuramoyl-L-alanine amidase [Victivallales bacterium]|nr:N-acetylmuramoyl-L-alanine amidase [Victivallales bacterium]
MKRAFLLILCLLLAGALLESQPLCAQSAGNARFQAAAKKASPRKVVLHSVTVRKRKYLYLREVAALYGCRYTYNSKSKQAVMVGSKGVRLEFKVNSVASKVNGVEVALSYPVIMHKDAMMLAVSDFNTLLQPIMRPSTVASRTVRTVVLDPGHGGKDTGAKFGAVQEKDYNLKIARRVGAILAKRGYRVLYTRTDDKALELSQRSKFAVKHKPDLFISIHCNSAADSSISGIEVFAANPEGTPSFGTTTIGKKGPGTVFDTVNALWAYRTQAALIKATAAADRGVKRKQFYVLRETPAPALLVECGFLSNVAERKKLTDNAYLDKIAVAICDGVDAIRRDLTVKNAARK